MHYKYKGSISLYNLEDDHLEASFEFTHKDQLVHCNVKAYALDYIFNNNLAPTNYCRIGTMDYNMERIV